jgi:hypothetical protein
VTICCLCGRGRLRGYVILSPPGPGPLTSVTWPGERAKPKACKLKAAHLVICRNTYGTASFRDAHLARPLASYLLAILRGCCQKACAIKVANMAIWGAVLKAWEEMEHSAASAGRPKSFWSYDSDRDSLLLTCVTSTLSKSWQERSRMPTPRLIHPATLDPPASKPSAEKQSAEKQSAEMPQVKKPPTLKRPTTISSRTSLQQLAEMPLHELQVAETEENEFPCAFWEAVARLAGLTCSVGREVAFGSYLANLMKRIQATRFTSLETWYREGSRYIMNPYSTCLR